MAIISKEESSFSEIAKVLSTDAALSAGVLRLANSPLGGGRYGASTIIQALSLLGITRVCGLVMTLSVSQFLKRAGRSELVRRAWRHNLACALAAKDFARTFDVDCDQAYTAGLLHDVGRLALAANNLAEYESLCTIGGDLREAEQAMFGIDHCAAGEWLIREWQLPESYAQSARLHHDPLDQSAMVNLVHVACNVANQLGFNVTGVVPDDSEAVISDELSYSIATTINAIECEYGL